MKLPTAAAATVKLFEELTPDDPRVAVRKLFGQPAAFVSGNLFFGVFGSDLFVRLSAPDRARAEREHGMRAFAPMAGRPMTEYRVLPAELLEEPAGAAEWVDRSLTWTASLPPKSVQRATPPKSKRPPARTARKK